MQKSNIIAQSEIEPDHTTCQSSDKGELLNVSTTSNCLTNIIACMNLFLSLELANFLLRLINARL